jgi:hypothetical protein
LTESVPAEMKNTVIIIKRNFTDRFLPKGESAEKQVLITQYKEMMQGLRSRFNSIEEVDGPDELADIINVVTDNGMKVVIIDDGTFVKDGQAAIEGLTGNAAGKYCAVSTAGLDLAETPFVNLNGMAMMGVGILNENDMLMQTAYALLTGESDVPPNFFRDEQGRIRWMVRLPKIVRIAIDVWQAEKIRRLFASAA